MKAYKLFKMKNGKLYPLYVFANEEMPIGVRLIAKCGESSKDGKHVKSKLGDLAMRPGFHTTEVPLANHIGKRLPDGSLVQAADTVWCEVEISDRVDYTETVKKIGTNKNGKVISANCCLKELPKETDWFYWFTTNPTAKARWLISGEITINKILSNEEVAAICRENGFEPQQLEVAS